MYRYVSTPYFIAVLLSFALAGFSQPHAAESWHEIRDSRLEVGEGTALDFTGVRPRNVAGSKGWVQVDQGGHLHFERDGHAQRFLCASMVPSAPNGGLPNKVEADRWVEQLSRMGYNLVRLHYIDAILMTGRKGDFDYDPVELDRLHYLMARLKSAGIYWIADAMTSNNGAYGDVQPHRWIHRHNLTERLLYDPSALEHWKRLVTSLWGQVNPYTGLTPIHDPAMLGVILVNEGSLAFLATLRGEYPKELQAPFGVWLASRYRDAAALNKSWAAEVSKGDQFGRSAELPRKIRGTGQRDRDFSTFVAELELNLFKNMDAHIRARGFKGLTTAYNNWKVYNADVSRGAVGWIDMHGYQSLPSGAIQPGSKLEQSSIFDTAGLYGRQIADTRQWGKPFTVTEYGQPFWNTWRHESAAWIPALAAFQDWDAICQFAELPVILSYGESGTPRRQAMYPFGVGADPIARGGERLAALLFLRGDVAPSRVRVKLGLDQKQVFVDGNAWGQVPENLSRLALVAAVGLDLSTNPAKPKGGEEIYFPLDTRPRSWIETAQNEALKRGILISKDPVERLKSIGLLSRGNRSDLSEGLYETDTGQILFDARSKRLSISTERTVVFTQRSGSAKAGGVELAGLSSPATVAVGALDDQVIGRSHRLLVWVLTDAINTGMEFSDPERTTLKKLGRFPPQIRAVTGKLAIKHSEAGALKVWAVDQTGRRVAMVPANAAGGFLRFAIDNVVPGVGPVTYFEVADR